MKWTKETPTAPGHYWYREAGVSDIVEISIEVGTGASLVQFIGDEEHHLAADQDAEWSGPLVVPE